MHQVILATHSAEVCPTSNAKTKALLLEIGPQIDGIGEKHGVKIVAGPFVSQEHLVVTVVEAERSEDVDDFLVESRLPQWNQLHILPARTMEEGMRELQESTPLF
jgi:hypothetical protein